VNTDLFIGFNFLAAGYTHSNKSFIYSLYNINGFRPIKLSIMKPQDATVGHPDYGPAFGGNGLDLVISSNASSHSGSCSYPDSYQIAPGCTKQDYCSFFTGTSTFSPNHVEVFYVKK